MSEWEELKEAARSSQATGLGLGLVVMPEAILELLAERDALKATVADMKEAIFIYQEIAKERDALKAELDRIRAMEPVAWCLGNPEHSDSSNLFLAHEFTPGGEHKDDWTALYTLEKP